MPATGTDPTPRPGRRPERRSRLGTVVGCVVLLAACAGFIPQVGPGPEPAARYFDLTRPILMMGDTQEHESTGYPLQDNDSAIDAYVEVAQRPPEQPLFGRRVMEWALKKNPDEPFIHLGDVMDLSCRSEAERMTKIFRSAGRSGAILPGNHDGLMFGIYSYRILDAVMDSGAKRWNQACRRGAAPEDNEFKTKSEAFSKRDFISLYLTEHSRFPDESPGLKPPPDKGVQRVSWRNPDPKRFFSAVEAKLLDGYQYADSFVAQRLVLPAAEKADRAVIVVALDTNQAGPLVTTWDTVMGRSPGSVGHVKRDQIDAVRKWVIDAARNGDIVVFAGHHNWNSLGLPTRLLLRNLMANVPHPLVYLSAHTHRGFWAEHRLLDSRPLLELNVSSLSDWPIAWRRVSFGYDERANRLLVRADLMPKLPDRPIRNDRDLLAAWDADACADIGVDPARLRDVDRGLVVRQRESRGSVLEWLPLALGLTCTTCDEPLYRHGQSYQDAMLEAMIQLTVHLPPEEHKAYEVKLPDWCRGTEVVGCARMLQRTVAADFREEVALFRRKALLVELLSEHLDDLRTPRASAYMACRAVQAAKIDFDLTDDRRNAFRGEANRMAEQFFRVEASVGME